MSDSRSCIAIKKDVHKQLCSMAAYLTFQYRRKVTIIEAAEIVIKMAYKIIVEAAPITKPPIEDNEFLVDPNVHTTPETTQTEEESHNA